MPVRPALRRTSRTPRRLLLAAAALAALLLTGCGVGQGSAVTLESGEPITVGVIPVADFAPVYIAQEEGFFAAEGLNVETKVMQNAAAIAPSVINGQLQFGTAAVPPFIAAAQKGLPLVAVANAASNTSAADEDPSALVVNPGSGITRPRDLEGRTVAVNALSSIVHLTAAASIERDGGDPSKATFVAMPFPDMVTALDRGVVDAASLVEPFQAKAVGAGAKVIANTYSSALNQDGTFALVFTAGPFAQKNPETVQAFTRAVDKASRLAAKDPGKVGEVLEKYGKLPASTFEEMRLPRYTDVLHEQSLADASKLMSDLGFLTEPADTEGLIWK